jgi:phosphohistidine phosphatase
MTATETKSHTTGYELYLMRHGIAAKHGADGAFDDAKRKLTAEGKDKLQDIAKGLKRLRVEFDWVLSSPLVRAAETAEIVRDFLGSQVPMEVCEALRPGESPEKLISFLSKHKERKRILLVGHEPDLGILAGRLIGAGHEANLVFKKGGCCLVACDHLTLRTPGELVWWLTPRVLRSLR